MTEGMVGLDTNILIRYIAQDDALQTPIANRIVDALTPAHPGWISITALAEMVWVLRRQFHIRRVDAAKILEDLLSRPEISIEQPELIREAVEIFRTSSADFSDCLIHGSGKIAGCKRTLTFDRKAARIPGMTLAV